MTEREEYGPIHYRICEVLDPTGLLIKAVEYTPIKETECGYWVVSQYEPNWLSPDELRKRKFAKWVSKTSAKRLCYPNIEEAIQSFKRRKEVQASRLRLQLEQADLAIEKFDEYKNASIEQLKGYVNIGEIPSASNLVWDY